MPIKPIPNQGLRVTEPEYLPLKAYQSGGFYWDGEAQKVIRSVLGDFLPPLIQAWQAGHRTGLFQLFDGDGQEVLSQSRQVGPRDPIPARELRQLRRNLETFKTKANSPDTTPNNRFIIQEFKLPDFDRDPDLYRISGAFWNRRLHVLWGCERAAESSLPPAAALAKLPSTRQFSIAKKYWSWLAALLALLLLLLCIWLFGSGRSHGNPEPSAQSGVTGSAGSAGPAGSGGAASSSSPGSTDSQGLPPLPAPSGAPSGGGGGSGMPPATGGAGAAAPAGGGPAAGAGAGTAQRTAASNQSQNESQNQNSLAAGLKIQKQGEKTLPDGKMEVQLAVGGGTGSGPKPKVDYWEVDGIKQAGDDEIRPALSVGRHAVKVHLEGPDGKPVELASSLVITLDARLEPAQ